MWLVSGLKTQSVTQVSKTKIKYMLMTKLFIINISRSLGRLRYGEALFYGTRYFYSGHRVQNKLNKQKYKTTKLEKTK